jgi:hypothetical protein
MPSIRKISYFTLLGFLAVESCSQFKIAEPEMDASGDGRNEAGSALDAPVGGASGGNTNIGSSGCVAGTPCMVPSTPCLVGTTACSGGNATCIPGDKRQANGTSCGVDTVCLDGTCSKCAAGASCDLSAKPCRVGAIDCTGGRPECLEVGNAAAGISCGAGMVCRDGNCVACLAGDPCVPTNPCHQGMLDCSGSMSRCIDANRMIPAGESCGIGRVCGLDGTCVSCMAGTSCDTKDPCIAGKIDCSSGSPQCADSGNAQNGKSCGVGKVCNVGICVSCSAGMMCTPTNKCHIGTLSCSVGTADCVDSNRNGANGSSCGDNMVCNNGNCVACTDATSCTTATPCKVAKTSCATGTSQCIDSGNSPNGTNKGCGSGRVCRDGICVACAEGMTCVPAPCRQGTITCAGGVSACQDNGIMENNGTPCGTMGHVCRNGACVACAEGSACSSGNACKTGGRTACATGSPVCTETNRPDGFACGATTCTGATKTDQQCRAGSCAAVATSCTPAQCNTARTDCSLCGNGRVDTGETCDPCNTMCISDTNTIRTPVGAAGTCTFRCNSTLRPCGPSDMFCPTGCASDSGDPDCKQATGTACVTNSQCRTNACANNRCCDSTCTGLCVACASSATGQADGHCAPLANGLACGPGSICNAGQCVTCGAKGQACCSGSGCDAGLSCSSGVCRIPDGSPINCAGNGDCASGSCSLVFADADGDGFGDETQAASQFCGSRAGFVKDHSDCCDSDSNVRPNQTETFPVARSSNCPGPRSFDYNCDGVETPQSTGQGVLCNAPGDPCTAGWVFGPPACGTASSFTICNIAFEPPFSCGLTFSSTNQCR